MNYAAHRKALTARDIGPLLLSTMITAIVFTIVFIGGLMLEENEIFSLETLVTLLTLILISSTLIIFVSAVVVGLPTAWLFRFLGWERYWTYIIAGFVAGVVVWGLMQYQQEPQLIGPWLGIEFPDILISGLPGALYAALWWMKTKHLPVENADA